MRKLLCINSVSDNAYINLATEEYLLKNSPHNIFMLYVNAPAVIIGKHQNTLSEINLQYIESNNITVVRRLSGGGTVYHDKGNVNYSWIMHAEQGKMVNFKKYTDDILAFLQSLQLNVVLNKNNDLLINEKKISGNAEHVFKNKLIHHGTLLFSTELNKLNRAIKTNLSKFEDKSVQSKRSQVTNIAKHLKNNTTITQFRNNLFNYIIEKYNYAEKYTLTAQELKLIEQLVTKKYKTWDWNFGYSPKYLFNKELKIKSYSLSINLLVKKGLISDITCTGNFLTDEEIHRFKQTFIGKQHRKTELKKAFYTENFKSILNKLSAENLLKLFF